MVARRQKDSSALTVELLAGERNEGESDNAVIACNDWLRIGSGRTLRKLLSKYSDIQRNSAPTQSLGTLFKWSSDNDWAERATAFDANWEKHKDAERAAMLNYGLALDYERVDKLNRLADLLEAQIYERDDDGNLHNVWVPDVKQIGSGENAERVDMIRFNPALFEQYRATLNDIAAEVGGRIKKSEVSGADGGPIKQEVVLDLSTLTNDQLSHLANTLKD